MRMELGDKLLRGDEFWTGEGGGRNDGADEIIMFSRGLLTGEIIFYLEWCNKKCVDLVMAKCTLQLQMQDRKVDCMRRRRGLFLGSGKRRNKFQFPLSLGTERH